MLAGIIKRAATQNSHALALLNKVGEPLGKAYDLVLKTMKLKEIFGYLKTQVAKLHPSLVELIESGSVNESLSTALL